MSWLIGVAVGAVLLAACAQPERTATPTVASTPTPTALNVPLMTSILTPKPTPKPTPTYTFEQRMWNQRIEAALEPSNCPVAPNVAIASSYYKGPLIDTHFHIPHLPDSRPGRDRDDENGVKPLLGRNVKMSDIACTLEQEGTAKAFAFFPVWSEMSGQLQALLDVVNGTMQYYPTQFVPFIMPPGKDDVPPTIDAAALTEMLAIYPGLFQGYGEIGLYELGRRRKAEDYPPDAPIFLEIYRVVKEHNLIVYLHPGEGHKDNLERALGEHPEISFIVHGEQIENDIGTLMLKYPNVYFTVNDLYGDQYLLHPGEDTDSFLAALSDYEPLLEKDLATWKDLIEAHPDQFFWGTDRGGIAVWTFDLAVGQALVDYARAFIGRLDPSVQDKFAYKNAEGLLSKLGKSTK